MVPHVGFEGLYSSRLHLLELPVLLFETFASTKMGIAGLPEDGKDRMRAAVYYDKHDIRIEDVPIPICHDNEVLIKVSGCFCLSWLYD